MDLEQLADLAMIPRGRPAKVHAEFIRNLKPEDLAKLPGRPLLLPSPLAKVRTTHHFAAKLIAEGQRLVDVSAATGYTPARLQQLKGDPAFAELIEHYKAQVNAKYINVHDRLAAVGLATLEELQDRLEEAPESFSNQDLQDQLKLLLDRSGYGPSSTVTVQKRGGLADDLLQQIKSELQSRGQVHRLEDVVNVPLLDAAE